MATAERVGFTFTADRSGRVGVQLAVRSGDKKDDIKLKLTPSGAISGRVTDADGEPMEGIFVSVMGGPSGMGQNAITDDKGQFRIGGLAPARYRVKAAPMNVPLPPEIRTDGTVEAHYIQTYYPNSPAEKSGGRVDVPAGAEVGGIGIQLLRSPVVGVSGLVADVPGGAEHMTIEIMQERSQRNMGIVKPDGTFQIWRLDPGKYTIAASGTVNGRNMRTAPVEIEVAESNIEHIELRFVAPSDIEGQVEFEGEPAPQAQPAPQARPAPRHLSFVDVSGGRASQTAELAADGSFRVEGMAPNRYRVTASWGPAFVKSMRLGTTVIEGNVLDLLHGSGGAPLSVLVSSATGEISGIVRDDKGPAAGKVSLWAVDGELYRFPMINFAGSDGAYRLSGLAPGKYKLAATGDNDPEDDDTTEVIEVQAGDKLTRDLKFPGS
jgi:protocatechuate 3,4-dioxygenase beta subunit